jgi:hypothetical protein
LADQPSPIPGVHIRDTTACGAGFWVGWFDPAPWTGALGLTVSTTLSRQSSHGRTPTLSRQTSWTTAAGLPATEPVLVPEVPIDPLPTDPTGLSEDMLDFYGEVQCFGYLAVREDDRWATYFCLLLGKEIRCFENEQTSSYDASRIIYLWSSTGEPVTINERDADSFCLVNDEHVETHLHAGVTPDDARGGSGDAHRATRWVHALSDLLVPKPPTVHVMDKVVPTSGAAAVAAGDGVAAKGAVIVKSSPAAGALMAGVMANMLPTKMVAVYGLCNYHGCAANC